MKFHLLIWLIYDIIKAHNMNGYAYPFIEQITEDKILGREKYIKKG